MRNTGFKIAETVCEILSPDHAVLFSDIWTEQIAKSKN